MDILGAFDTLGGDDGNGLRVGTGALVGLAVVGMLLGEADG
jgi:hypothetical protein